MFPALAARALPYRWIAIGIAFALLLGAIGVQTVRLASSKTDVAELKADWALERATLERKARVAVQKLAAQKAAHAANQQEIVHAYNKERQARAADASRRATDDRVRNAIRDFAGGGQRAGSDPAACRGERDRSATLGLLLEEADGLAGEFATAAEQHAGEVRFLKRVIENDRAGCRPLPTD